MMVRQDTPSRSRQEEKVVCGRVTSAAYFADCVTRVPVDAVILDCTVCRNEAVELNPAAGEALGDT